MSIFRGHVVRWRRLLLALGLLCGATLVYQQSLIHDYEESMTVILDKSASNLSHKFLVDTPGCHIPDLSPVNPDIRRFLTPQEPDPKCSEKEKWSFHPKDWLSWFSWSRKNPHPPLVQSNLTAMWVVREAMHHYGISDLSSLACCYRTFWRLHEDPNKYTEMADCYSRFSEECVPFDGEVTDVDHENVEFVRVECSRNDVEVYRDYHAFVPLKRTVEERCRGNNESSDDQLSILIIGLDSVSRLNMLRQLPKTYQLLTSPPFSAISLLGYNKVGDNTFPNVIPLLTGLSEDELRAKCYSEKKKIDDCPFIWKDLASRGYRTMFGEDLASISIFNYLKTGFVMQPTDYYGRPFFLESYNELGNTKRSGVKLCTGFRQTFHYMVDYIKKFATRFTNKRSFGFFWSSIITHEDMNMPNIGDSLLADGLAKLRESGALERSVLVLMSDHGMRFGKFRETYQGRMEERLPFLMLSFPEWFRRRFPEAVANLQVNADNRLTTPFDVHETLRDLLQPAAHLHSDVLRARVRDVTPPRPSSAAGNTTEGRGVSLFVAISPLRTCEDAAISPHWCTCQTSQPVSISLPVIKSAVDFVVDQLNKLITSNCEFLHLSEVKYAEEKVPHEEGIPKKFHAQLMDYLVAFKTEPGAAVFEATVRRTSELKKGVSAKFSLTGSISRLSAYGSQSHCVSDATLKLYCYCKHQLMEQTTSNIPVQ